MKKTAIILTVCAMLLTSASAGAAKNVEVYLNGSQLSFEQPPIIRDDRTFVPLRSIFENYGMKVEWDSETNSIYAYNGENEISLSIGSREMWVNGECIKLDTAPFISEDLTFVPLRAISEALKCAVEWDGIKGAVIIIGKPSQSAKPTVAPTTEPTAIPTAEPTTAPSAEPTAVPTAVPTAEPTAAPTQQPSTEAELERAVFDLVNQERAKNGLDALKWAEDLAAVARAHSADMINRGFFSHTNPDGQSPFDRLKNAGISYKSAAENIAYGQRSAEAVMNSWMNSSGHRANILNKNLKEIGVGAVKNSNGTIYWTQVFVTR